MNDNCKEGPTEPFDLQSEDRKERDIFRSCLRSDIEADYFNNSAQDNYKE